MAVQADISIYKNCFIYQWIKLTQFDEDYKDINENVLNIAIECLKKMENENSPYEKIIAFSKCYEIIQTLISFCKGDKHKKEDIGIYIYTTIRALPLKLTTNLLYIQIYLTKELSSPYFQNLINLIETIIRKIVMLTHNDLIGVSKEEFDENVKKIQGTSG